MVEEGSEGVVMRQYRTVSKKDMDKEDERRRVLRSKINAAGGMKVYSDKVGITSKTIQKMLIGDTRVSDRALGR